jgi:hypothetical protein
MDWRNEYCGTFTSDEINQAEKDLRIRIYGNELFKNIDGEVFSDQDDLRLIVTRIRDSFVAGLNYESCKSMIKIVSKRHSKHFVNRYRT